MKNKQQDVTKTIISSLVVSINLLLLYFIDFLFIKTDVSIIYSVFYLVVLFSFISFKLFVQHKETFYSNNFSEPNIIFLNINIFAGAIIGYVIGALMVWFMIFPFSMIYGHPEKPWPKSVNIIFDNTSLLLIAISILLVIWYAMNSYFKRFEHSIIKPNETIKEERK